MTVFVISLLSPAWPYFLAVANRNTAFGSVIQGRYTPFTSNGGWLFLSKKSKTKREEGQTLVPPVFSGEGWCEVSYRDLTREGVVSHPSLPRCSFQAFSPYHPGKIYPWRKISHAANVVSSISPSISPLWSFSSKAGVFKKLSLAGLAKLSRLRYSWIRFGLASACYSGLRVHDRPVYSAG
jgi:hypothetical protein